MRHWLYSTLALLLALPLCAQDTVRFTACTYHWPPLSPLNGSNVQVEVSGVGTYGLPTGPDKHCIEMSIPLTGLLADTRVLVKGSKTLGTYATQPLNGVTVGDMMRIICHILGTKDISNFGWLSADINGSGNITSFDIVELRKLILGKYTNFPNKPVWTLLPSYYEFPNPANPFPIEPSPDPASLPLDEFRAYDGDTIRVYGMKTGDIDGDANFEGPYTGNPAPGDTLQLTFPPMTIPANTVTAVPIYLEKSTAAAALQLEFYGFGGIQYIGCASGRVQVTEETFHVISGSGNSMRLVLDSSPHQTTHFAHSISSPLFHVLVKFPTEVKLNANSLWLGIGIPPLAFSQCGEKAYRVSLRLNNLLSAVEQPASAALQASGASPNPFSEQAWVQLDLPESMPVLLEVFDASGRLTWLQEQALGRGPQQLEIPAQAVAPGTVGFYRIQAGAGVAVGKLVRE